MEGDATSRSHALAALVACALLLSIATVAAQPYAADGGFGRPDEIVGHQQRPAIAVVVDAGVATLARVDNGRILLAPLHAVTSAEVLASGEAYVDVIAATGQVVATGDVATAPAVYAWYSRDLTTGRYVYAWHHDGTTRRLLEAPQVLDVRLAVGPHGPEAWVIRTQPSGARIERHGWVEGDVEIVHESGLSLAEPAVSYARDGARHLAYLEGFTDVTDFGVNAHWVVRYLPPGADAGDAVELGAAAPPPNEVTVVADDVRIAWTDDAGMLVVAAPDGDAVPIGTGRAVAATPQRLYSFDGASIVAHDRPVVPGAGVNVAWSPMGIERAFAARDAEGVTHLVWAGRRAGGGFALFVSDDRSPMARSLADRAAATFGWAPWSVAEEALAQGAGALLTGTIATMALIPLLWLLAALVVGRVPHHRTRLVGALIAAGLIAVALAGVVARLGDVGHALVGLPWIAPLAVAIGVAAGSAGLRRVDMESLQAMVFGACITCFVSVTILAFTTFQGWMRLLDL